MRRLFGLLSVVLTLALLGCGGNPQTFATKGDGIASLAQAIQALGPNVDPDEAWRAARRAYTATDELAEAYEIEDPALIHNMKVNAGLKPRGLCWHWAEDMEKALNAEEFETLVIYRAIANADVTWRIDHSTSIISARGETMEEGIVLDPWRYGGVLFWSPLVEDTRYHWVPRMEVLRWRAAQKAAG